MSDRTPRGEARGAAPTPSPAEMWDGTIILAQGGGFATVAGDGLERLQVPMSAARELRALLGLRDDATRLLGLEAASVDDTEEITAARASLMRDYGATSASTGR